MKRIISICIAALMILTSLPVISFAAGEISVISPTASVYSDLAEFEVDCEGAEKIIFKLDGNVIGETAGATTLAVPDGLTVGNHVFEAIAVYADGTAASAKQEFDVSAYIEKFSLSDAGTLTGFWSANVNNRAEKTEIAGSSGKDGDVAAKLGITVNDNISSSNPYWEHSGGSFSKAGIKRLAFDIKIESATKNGRLMLGGIDGLASYGNVIQNGKWLGGSNKATSDGWVHMELDSNHYENKIVLRVDGQVLYDGAIAYKTSGGLRFNLYQIGARTDSTRAWIAFDNLEWSQHFVYGISSIECADSAGNWQSNSAAMPTDASKIRIALTEPLDAASVTADTVTLYDNGMKVNLSNVAYDAAGNYVTVTLGESLSNDSEIVLRLADSVTLTNNAKKASGTVLEARMRTEAAELAPTDIAYKKNSSYLAATEQLRAGDIVSVDMTLNNGSGESKTMAAFVSVIQNGKIRALGAVERDVSPSGSVPVTVTLPTLSALDADGGIKVKVMICNGISATQPYMDYYELN